MVARVYNGVAKVVAVGIQGGSAVRVIAVLGILVIVTGVVLVSLGGEIVAVGGQVVAARVPEIIVILCHWCSPGTIHAFRKSQLIEVYQSSGRGGRIQ